MKLVIIGATGGTGQQLVRQAIEDGHEVIAMARRPEAVTLTSPRLQIVRGDALDPDTLSEAMRGVEAVISALGVGNDIRGGTVTSRGTGHIAAVMAATGVRRLLCVTSAGNLYDPRESFVYRVFGRALLKNLHADHQRTEDIVRATDLDYTIVKPPRLTNGKRTDVYRVVRESYVPGGTSLSRADLAAFLLAEAQAGHYLRAAVSIAY